jgi:hypothetical protein
MLSFWPVYLYGFVLNQQLLGCGGLKMIEIVLAIILAPILFLSGFVGVIVLISLVLLFLDFMTPRW